MARLNRHRTPHRTPIAVVQPSTSFPKRRIGFESFERLRPLQLFPGCLVPAFFTRDQTQIPMRRCTPTSTFKQFLASPDINTAGQICFLARRDDRTRPVDWSARRHQSTGLRTSQTAIGHPTVRLGQTRKRFAKTRAKACCDNTLPNRSRRCSRITGCSYRRIRARFTGWPLTGPQGSRISSDLVNQEGASWQLSLRGSLQSER